MCDCTQLTILGNSTFGLLGTSSVPQPRGSDARPDVSEPDWRLFAALAGRLLILFCPRITLMGANMRGRLACLLEWNVSPWFISVVA
ncbi:MAG: hypothetical protein ACI87E_002292 [Mariniblastus sp.]|jgi:hypothetical protein